MEWISVEDRLPPYAKRVLVVWSGSVQNHAALLLKDRDGLHAWFFNQEADILPFDDPTPITHWMPLPEPPEDR